MSESPDALQARLGVRRHPPEAGPGCAYVQDLAASYVLAALEPDEHRRVDRHRSRCPICDDVIAATRETVNFLALSVPVVAPPVRAKSALMERIAQVSQTEAIFPQPPLAASSTTARPTLTIPSSRGVLAPTPEGWDEANQSQSRPQLENSNRGGRFRPNWQLLATPLATVPLVLALGIVGIWAMQTQNRLSARSSEVETLSLQVDTLTSRVTTLNNTLADVDKFIQAPDAMRYDMTASDGASMSKAVGQIIANPGTDEAMLVVKGLSGSHTMYEVILESDGGRLVSAGDLPVSADGAGRTVLELTQPFATYRSVHVKPKLDDNSGGASDSVPRGAPDALSGVIDPSLGSAGDTDVPDAGQSN